MAEIADHRAPFHRARKRRSLDLFFVLASLLWAVLATNGTALAQTAGDIVLMDAVDRRVVLDHPARRIVTNESQILLSLALLDPEPVKLLAGWAAPERFDKGMLEAFRQKFPEIDNVPVVGKVVPGNFPVESIIAIAPDLFVVGLWEPGWAPVVEKIEQAGIPVIYLDSPDKAALPVAEATAFSIQLLGQAIGQTEKADAFARFQRDRYADIQNRIAKGVKHPKVLLDAHAGEICCNAPGARNRLVQYVQVAGGEIIGSSMIPGYSGQLSPEYVLAAQPDVYIGTGGPHLAARGGLVLGAGIPEAAARASLRDVVSRNLLSELTAVIDGNAHGISHQLTISALNILVAECFAKWIHPELFDDLDPSATLTEINQMFLAVPLEGSFWVDLSVSGNTAGSSQ